MARTTVYMGRSKQGTHIYADIEIRPGNPDRMVTFMDHSTGAEPDEVSICFTELKVKDNPRTTPDRNCLGGGQIPAADRVIVKPISEHVALIEKAWESDHLNNLNAACDHMTPEMLNPTAEQLAEYAKANPHVASYSLVQYWRLDRVVCPETGYKYGHSWLARTPDPEIVAGLSQIVA